jgi:flagellar basal-body rod protein FlgC
MTKLIKLVIFSTLFSHTAFASGLDDALMQSAAGMRVQSERMKVVSENIANQSSTGTTPGAEPYRRKTINFKNKVDKQTGVEMVTVNKIGRDYKTPLNAKFDPSNPAADEKGYVLTPNVDTPIEMVDMKEAQRAYEANMSAMSTSKKMYMTTIELLK